MSIGKRVSEAIEKMKTSDPEGALFAICSAIDATAKKEFDCRGGSGYKKFIQQNLGLITNIAFSGREILNLNLKYEHPEIKKGPDGMCSIQDVLYHAIRCGLYHEAELPKNIKFAKENIIQVENGKLVLPANLINGFIIAVVTSLSNKDEKSLKRELLNLWGFPVPVNKLWGRRNELLWLMDALSEVASIQSQQRQKQKTAAE